MLNNDYTGRVIDGHCHIASNQFIPTEFFLGLAQNMRVKLQALGANKTINQLLDNFLKGSQDHEGDRLLAEMTAASIDQAVLLLPDFTYVMDTELTIAEMFEKHNKIRLKHKDRFIIFAGVDPRWGADGIDLFEKGVTEYGFRGLKLYPPCGYSPSDESLYPYYEICKKFHLPVLFHSGPSSPTLEFGYSAPSLIDKAAFDFPDVNFIIAHGGVTQAEETCRMCAYRPNVYTDISAFLGSLHPMGWSVAMTELFKRGINHKIIFGTDWPVFQNSGGHRKVMAKFTGPNGPLKDLAKAQQSLIMHKNIERLLSATEG